MIDVVGARLRNERLAGSTIRRPEDVVAWMGAVQAQDYAGARWAVGQRFVGPTDAAVARAFDDGRILRTHILRPTWHFVHPADIRWMLAVSAPRVHAANGFSYRTNALDAKTLARGADRLCRALEGHRHLTRTELAGHLKAARLPHAGQALAYIVMHAELEALLCSGPRRGSQFTYALLDERVPRATAIDVDEALGALARRYFASHGPATLRDFVWWSGMTTTQVKRGVDIAGRDLESAVLDGRTHWWKTGVRSGRTPAWPAYLLPNYDEFLIAFKDRQWSASGSGAAPRFGPMAGLPHHLVIDGRVEGAWRRTNTSGGVQVDVAPYRRLSPADSDALSAAVARYAAFLEGPVTVTVRTC